MGKLKEQKSQLHLFMAEEDLRRPKHDEIMCWLDNWVRQVENVRSFLGGWRERQESSEALLVPESISALEKTSVSLSAIKEMERRSSKVSRPVPWPNEPVQNIKFLNLQWERPLSDGSSGYNRTIGYADMSVQYEIGWTLIGAERIHFEMDSQSFNSILKSICEPKEVGRAFSFETQSEILELFFEVKTEIRSIGELMRQLQTYRSAPRVNNACRRCGTGREFGPGLIVVAPPNFEAERIVRSHGFGWVNYATELTQKVLAS